jgi:hypothetical protein
MLEAIDDLRVDRMLDPERAVLIEFGDAFGRRYEIRAAFVVVALTNSMIACFAGPSFHDGRTPARPCAFAAVATASSDMAGSAAAVESRTRRLIREEGRVGFMFAP